MRVTPHTRKRKKHSPHHTLKMNPEDAVYDPDEEIDTRRKDITYLEYAGVGFLILCWIALVIAAMAFALFILTMIPEIILYLLRMFHSSDTRVLALDPTHCCIPIDYDNNCGMQIFMEMYARMFHCRHLNPLPYNIVVLFIAYQWIEMGVGGFLSYYKRFDRFMNRNFVTFGILFLLNYFVFQF